MSSVTVLIAEDDADIREQMRLFLMEKGYSVIQATDGFQVLEMLEEEKPDLMLLDIEMTGMNGLEVCRRVRLKTTLPILFVSYRKEMVYKIQGLEAGGDDYITKPFDFNELEARIRAVLRRNDWEKNGSNQLAVLKYGDLHIHVDSRELYIRGEQVKLHHKEFRLLLLLAQTPNRVWTAEQLYDQVWGYYSEGDIQTVKVHISKLRKKIETNPAKPKFIGTVRGFGYKFIWG